MPYYVAPGKAITSPRGIISGSDVDSEVTWQRLCKHKDDPKAEKSARDQLPRLVKCGALVKADKRPLTPREVTALEARDKITETIPLQRSQGLDGRKIGVKGRQAAKLAESQERERVAKLAEKQKQSVDLSGDAAAAKAAEEAKAAEDAAAAKAAEEAKAAEDAAAAKAAEEASKGGAKRAAKPKGD